MVLQLLFLPPFSSSPSFIPSSCLDVSKVAEAVATTTTHLATNKGILIEREEKKGEKREKEEE